MLYAYYFRHHPTGYLLAPVYAKNELDATILLPIQHSWCKPNANNTTLERVEKGTEYDRICAS